MERAAVDRTAVERAAVERAAVGRTAVGRTAAAGHAARLHLPGDSPVHRLPPEVKIVSVLIAETAVVLTPREAFWAFGAYALLLLAVAVAARVPAGWLGSRILIEAPFILFAVLLPVAAGGERIVVAGLPLSVDGLLGGWNIVAKGTLGVLGALLLAATTSPRDLVVGLARLRVPPIVVQIALLMIRYIDVIADQAARMRIARLSRGSDPRFLWQARAFGSTLGVLFLRSYERGERVYLAMISRGYTGRLPVLDDDQATTGQWAAASALPAAATAVLMSAWLLG